MNTNNEREASFMVREDNNLTNLFRIHWGNLALAGVKEQLIVLTRDELKESLGQLYSAGKISTRTIDKISAEALAKQVSPDIAALAKLVQAYELPRGYKDTSTGTGGGFDMCHDGHGHFHLNGISNLEWPLYRIHSFEAGLRTACALVESRRVQPVPAAVALQKIERLVRMKKLSLKQTDEDREATLLLSDLSDMAARDSRSNGARPNTPENDSLVDLFRSIMGSGEDSRSQTRPTNGAPGGYGYPYPPGYRDDL